MAKRRLKKNQNLLIKVDRPTIDVDKIMSDVLKQVKIPPGVDINKLKEEILEVIDMKVRKIPRIDEKKLKRNVERDAMILYEKNKRELDKQNKELEDLGITITNISKDSKVVLPDFETLFKEQEDKLEQDKLLIYEEIISDILEYIDNRIKMLDLKSGKDGLDGKDGAPGADGKDGVDGKSANTDDVINEIIDRSEKDWRFRSKLRGPISEAGGCKIDNAGKLIEVNHICYPDANGDTPTDEGCLYYSASDHTFEFINDIEDTVMQIGQELWVRSANVSGSDIANGAVVYISGVQSDRPKIDLADADDHDKYRVLGMATNTIAQGDEGWVTTFGLVRGIDTSHLTQGGYVYLSTTAGLTTDTPTTHYIRVGLCVREHPVDGIILLNPENEDHNLLHVYSLQGGIEDERYHMTDLEHQFATGDLWDDLRVASQSFKVRAAINEPDFEKVIDNGSGSTGVFGYHFAPNVEQEIFFDVQFPHAWKEGSDVKPHVHWMPTTTNAGNVVFQLEFTRADVNDVFGNTSIITVTDAADGTALKHQIASFSDVDMDGYLLSNMWMCRLSRLGGDAGDTYPDDVVITEFDIHFLINAFGSRQEFVK